jgi:hypothetical protein
LFDAVALDRTMQTQTVDAVAKILPLFVFLDLVQETPETEPPNMFVPAAVDMVSEIEALAETSFASDLDFHQAVNDVFYQIHDTHTRYRKPAYYDFSFVQPFELSAQLAGDGDVELFVSGVASFVDEFDDAALYESMVGATVLALDGADALEVMVNFTTSYGYISKDVSAAFNQMLRGNFQTRELENYPLPSSPSQVYTLNINETSFQVNAPWLALANRNIELAPQKSQAEVLKSDFDREHEVPGLAWVPNDKRAASWRVLDSGTVVIRLTSFSTSNQAQWFRELEAAMLFSEANEVGTLIVDLRGNGGGSICLGFETVHRIMGETRPEGLYDIRQCPLHSAIMLAGASTNASLISPGYWSSDLENGTFYDDGDLSWYAPGQSYVRGGIENGYSELTYRPCDPYPELPYSHAFAKIVLLTDGWCGSTCGVFTTGMREVYDNVVTVGIGGYDPTVPMSYQSFTGGQVLESTQVDRWKRDLNLAGEFVPPDFPSSNSMRFAWREIYPWSIKDHGGATDASGLLPLEYVFLPADYRLANWYFGDDDEGALLNLYGEVEDLMRGE